MAGKPKETSKPVSRLAGEVLANPGSSKIAKELAARALTQGRSPLLAGWAMHRRGQEDRPKLGRIHATMEHYRAFLSSGHSLVIGDLNDNLIWDTPRNPSFARLTALLSEMGLVNLYHARTGEEPSSESRGSLYFYRRADRPYLIDHVYLPEDWLGRVAGLTLGAPVDWLDLSDHTPLVVDLRM